MENVNRASIKGSVIVARRFLESVTMATIKGVIRRPRRRLKKWFETLFTHLLESHGPAHLKHDRAAYQSGLDKFYYINKREAENKNF